LKEISLAVYIYHAQMKKMKKLDKKRKKRKERKKKKKENSSSEIEQLQLTASISCVGMNIKLLY